MTSTFDDPNFIPGEFLDDSGEPSFVAPIKVGDVLVSFTLLVVQRESTLWNVAVIIFISWLIQEYSGWRAAALIM
jgi:hypothetical protein